MAEIFYSKFQILLPGKDDSNCSFIIDDVQYAKTFRKVKEIKEKKKNWVSIIFQATSTFEPFLRQETEGQMMDIKYFCRIEEMFNAINTAHLKIGHKKDKAMQAELKYTFCNISTEAIKIYLN